MRSSGSLVFLESRPCMQTNLSKFIVQCQHCRRIEFGQKGSVMAKSASCQADWRSSLFSLAVLSVAVIVSVIMSSESWTSAEQALSSVACRFHSMVVNIFLEGFLVVCDALKVSGTWLNSLRRVSSLWYVISRVHDPFLTCVVTVYAFASVSQGFPNFPQTLRAIHNAINHGCVGSHDQ